MKLEDFKNDSEFDPSNINKEYTFYSIFYDDNTINIDSLIIIYDNRNKLFKRMRIKETDTRILTVFDSHVDYEWLFRSKEEIYKKSKELESTYNNIIEIMNVDREKFFDKTEIIIKNLIQEDNYYIPIILVMQIEIFLKAIRNKDISIAIVDNTNNGV